LLYYYIIISKDSIQILDHILILTIINYLNRCFDNI